MKISGFTFMRNTSKLFYPFIESMKSILPHVDEFVIAMGDNDADDTTLQSVLALNDPKIKIIQSPWDTKTFPKNTEYARQTDIAMNACTGDWLFYLQSDEVVHEDDIPEILENCKKYLDVPEVEGFLFQYNHFWGDYDHVHRCHGHYPREIRIVRKQKHIHSWNDAQSFRKIYGYKGHYTDYFNKENTEKLKVIEIKARIFHYGFVRPPDIMYRKAMMMRKTRAGGGASDYAGLEPSQMIDYGPLDRVSLYKGTHPKAMHEKIKAMDWDHLLQKSGPVNKNRPLHRHERLRNRITTFFEKLLGREIGGFHNYRIIKDKHIKSKKLNSNQLGSKVAT